MDQATGDVLAICSRLFQLIYFRRLYTAPEVFRIRNNLLEHTAREKVISSLKHGGLCGSPTSIDVSTISTDSLDASIRYINAMSNDSENIKYLEKIVVAIRRLRKSTLERDIGAQVNCLSYIDAFCWYHRKRMDIK